MTREQLLRAQASARVLQERADDSLTPWNIRAPAPVLGEDVSVYRRKLAAKLKRLLPEEHELRKIQYRTLNDTALAALEPQLYQTVRDIALDPASVPRGTMREVVKVDPKNGHKEIHFVGRESFVRDFTRPGRQVVSFLHRYNTSGIAFR